MQVFLRQKLAILAMPKTGSTALEMSLRPRADLVFRGTTKHTPASKFHHKIAPFLKEAYGVEAERVAIMREPVSQIRSWYRYRCGQPRRMAGAVPPGTSFDDFVEALLQDKPPEYARIGSQFRFLSDRNGALLIHSLFAYERAPVLLAYLEQRFEREITLERMNVSAYRPAPLSAPLYARLRQQRAAEFALYETLIQHDGFLAADPDNPVPFAPEAGAPEKASSGEPLIPEDGPLPHDQA